MSFTHSSTGQRKTTSSYAGVSRRSDGRWKASVQHNGKRYEKTLANEIDAAKWVDSKVNSILFHNMINLSKCFACNKVRELNLDDRPLNFPTEAEALAGRGMALYNFDSLHKDISFFFLDACF